MVAPPSVLLIAHFLVCAFFGNFSLDSQLSPCSHRVDSTLHIIGLSPHKPNFYLLASLPPLTFPSPPSMPPFLLDSLTASPLVSLFFGRPPFVSVDPPPAFFEKASSCTEIGALLFFYFFPRPRELQPSRPSPNTPNKSRIAGHTGSPHPFPPPPPLSSPLMLNTIRVLPFKLASPPLPPMPSPPPHPLDCQQRSPLQISMEDSHNGYSRSLSTFLSPFPFFFFSSLSLESVVLLRKFRPM